MSVPGIPPLPRFTIFMLREMTCNQNAVNLVFLSKKGCILRRPFDV